MCRCSSWGKEKNLMTEKINSEEKSVYWFGSSQAHAPWSCLTSVPETRVPVSHDAAQVVVCLIRPTHLLTGLLYCRSSQIYLRLITPIASLFAQLRSVVEQEPVRSRKNVCFTFEGVCVLLFPAFSFQVCSHFLAPIAIISTSLTSLALPVLIPLYLWTLGTGSFDYFVPTKK